MIVDGRDRSCRSDDLRPAAQHALVDGMIHEAVAVQLRTCLLPFAGRLWEEARQSTPRAPFRLMCSRSSGHSRSHASKPTSFVDEAQGSDGAMLSVLGRQRCAQIIDLGDPYQKIYGRRGAIIAMAQIDAPECALTESFRFGATCAVACRCQNCDEIICVPFVAHILHSGNRSSPVGAAIRALGAGDGDG
ncbi:hypothetical protein VSR34_19860 [Paraburkholderia sp. JHI2823]|uniref:hypothetical protein n=1 Tax=Paraburkholderia TaxID=1822464 RepID=UPI00048422DC|nr:hypothetical protein [Paraburkholderia mimosarum]